MTDIFGSEKQAHGAKSLVTFSGVLVYIKDQALKLAQRAELRYTRQSSNVYELGSEDVYTVLTPATGTLQLQYIVSLDKAGNTDNAKWLGQNAGCNEAGEVITLQAGKPQCSGELRSIITCSGCVLTELGWSATAGQGAFQTNATYTVGVVS